MNTMKNVRVEKVTLNIGVGKNMEKLEKSMKLLKYITGRTPIKTFTKKRIPSWGLRPGLPIGCKVTLRHANCLKLLKQLLEAKENKLSEMQFDAYGNVAFGIPEYIDIPGIKYDPVLGIIGLEVCVTLDRPGFRIKRRRINKRKIPSRHTITKDEAVEFMKKEFNIKIGEKNDL